LPEKKTAFDIEKIRELAGKYQ